MADKCPAPQVTNVAWESSQVILPGQRLGFAKAVENWLCLGSQRGHRCRALVDEKRRCSGAIRQPEDRPALLRAGQDYVEAAPVVQVARRHASPLVTAAALRATLRP